MKSQRRCVEGVFQLGAITREQISAVIKDAIARVLGG